MWGVRVGGGETRGFTVEASSFRSMPEADGSNPHRKTRTMCAGFRWHTSFLSSAENNFATRPGGERVLHNLYHPGPVSLLTLNTFALSAVQTSLVFSRDIQGYPPAGPKKIVFFLQAANTWPRIYPTRYVRLGSFRGWMARHNEPLYLNLFLAICTCAWATLVSMFFSLERKWKTCKRVQIWLY